MTLKPNNTKGIGLALAAAVLLQGMVFGGCGSKDEDTFPDKNSAQTHAESAAENQTGDPQTAENYPESGSYREASAGSPYAESENGDAEKSANPADRADSTDPVGSITLSSSSAGESEKDAVETKLSSMSLEDKVAQMFAVTPEELTGVDVVTEAGAATENAFDSIPVGGITYLEQNLTGYEQTRTMLASVQQYSEARVGLPAFTFVDEEGGTVRRVSGNPGFDGIPEIGNMSDIGASGDPSKAYDIGKTIGSYLGPLGFNVDFAPVADTLTNPDNEVVRLRAFSSDPNTTAQMAVQCGRGLEDAGIIACYKHFPGHGATAADTHEGYAYTEKTLDELKQSDLIPFQAAIDNGALFIMVAHISLPNVVGDDTPASLSHTIVTDLLRQDMGYEGICITDALQMGAVADMYGTGEAAVQAIEAGEDMLLMPADLNEAYQAVLTAISSGRITEERINESVRRILKVKMGMNKAS